jgi:multiple sugar transport system ATP-binding protein
MLRQTASPGATIRLIVRDVEPLGPHMLAIGSVGRFPFTAQMPVGVAAAPDQSFEVALDLERAHLFDKATGQMVAV